MGEGKEPKPFLTKEPHIILKVSGIDPDNLSSYTKASLQKSIVENLGWSIYDLSKLEAEEDDEFSEWNSKRIQGCLAKHNTSILQLILVQQGHMYIQLKKKIAKAKQKMKEIDAEIKNLEGAAFLEVMAIFAEQLYCIAALAFAFASTPLIPAVIPAVIGFATTGFTLRNIVSNVTQKEDYKNERKRIKSEIDTLSTALEKDLWHDYIYPPEMTERMLIERSISEESLKEDRRENQVQVKVEDQLYQQAQEIRKLREDVTSLQAQIEDMRGKQLKK